MNPLVALRGTRTVLVLSAFALALWGCPPSNDITVAPAPKPKARFVVDVPPARADGRLPPEVVPRGEEVALRIDPKADRFSGRVRIDLELTRPVSAIVLHAADLDIAEAHIETHGQRIEATPSLRAAVGAKGQKEELVVAAQAEVPIGNAVLDIRFSGPLDEKLRGIYRVRDGEDAYVFTMFEPSDARRMFPCFDDPIHKISYTMSVEVPAGHNVFGNAPEARRSPASGGFTRVDFQPTKALSSYLVALAVGPFEVMKHDGGSVPLRIIAPRGRGGRGKEALAIADAQLARLADFFGRPYPYAKLDLVAVPNFAFGAMENAGLVTFREELLLLDQPAAATATRTLTTLLAHELSHQWFGNLVTMKWWDDLWLNEGFATHLEARLVDGMDPSLGAGLELLGTTGRVMDMDGLRSARVVRQPVRHTYQAIEAFDGITYIKGAAVLGMLEAWIGEANFQKGVRTYVAAHAWGNASASDLFAALHDTSHENVTAVASTFVDKPGVPLVRATLLCRSDGPATVQLSQQRYQPRQTTASERQLWRIPVCLSFPRTDRRKASGKGAKKAPGRSPTERVCTVLRGASASLELPASTCPAWVLPNADHRGYYRYAMSSGAMRQLGVAVRHLGARDEIGFYTNAWALVQSGDLPVVRLLELVETRLRERTLPRREVLEPLLRILQRVDDALVEDGQRRRYARFVSRLLVPHAKRLGWDPRKGEPARAKLVRDALLRALITMSRHPWLKREAAKRAKRYLQDPVAGSSETAAIALRAAARFGDVEPKALRAFHTTATRPTDRIAAVQALASVRDPKALGGHLDMMLQGTIRAQDAIYAMRAANDWHDSRAAYVDWMRAHFASLKKRFPGFLAGPLLRPVGRLCHARDRDRFSRALRDELVRPEARRLRESFELADLCIDLRARQEAAVTAWLKGRRRP